MITAVILLHLQSSDDIMSKLKIQRFNRHDCYTLDDWGGRIHDEHGYRIYNAVGADYKVVLGIGRICW